jgi:hypothetical protein
MKENVFAAIILSIGVIAAAFVHAGRYYALVANGNTVVRVDRWTGETKVIVTNGEWWREFEKSK